MKNLTKKLISGTLLASSLLFSNYVKGQEKRTLINHGENYECKGGKMYKTLWSKWSDGSYQEMSPQEMPQMKSECESKSYNEASPQKSLDEGDYKSPGNKSPQNSNSNYKTPSPKKEISDAEKIDRTLQGINDALYLASELIELFGKKNSNYKNGDVYLLYNNDPTEWWADTSNVNWWSNDNREKWWEEKYEQRKVVFGDKGDIKSGESIWDPNAEYEEETRFQGNMKTGLYVVGGFFSESKTILTAVEKGTELEKGLKEKDFWFLKQQEAKNYFAKNNWYWDDESEFEKNKRTVTYLMTGKTQLNEVAEKGKEIDDLLQETIKKYWWLNKE